MNTYKPITNLPDLDGRILRATPPRGRSAALIANHAGCRPDITQHATAPA